MKNNFVIFILILFSNAILGQLQPPELQQPENYAHNISATENVFIWSFVDSADFYEIEIDDNADFASPLTSEIISNGNQYENSPLFESWNFFWRVRGGRTLENGENDYSEWSEIYEFITEFTTPENIVPADAESNVRYDSLLFNWDIAFDPAVEAAGYTCNLQLSLESGFSNPDREFTVVNKKECWVAGIAPGEEYWWRVKYSNSAGESEWSAPTSFYTRTQPLGTVTLISPENGAADISPLNIEFSWNPVSAAETYLLELGSDSLFREIIESQDVTETSFVLSLSCSGEKIFWRVRAENIDGFGNWSEVRCFTTSLLQPQERVVLTAPVDSSVLFPGLVNFAWNSVAFATEYRFQLSDSSIFTSLVEDTLLTDSLKFSLSLKEVSSLYWRVRGENAGGAGPWSRSNLLTISTGSGIDDGEEKIPESMVLLQNYPNPFNPSTAIDFYLSKGEKITLVIFDVLGREIIRLIDNVITSSGYHSTVWDGKDKTGHRIGSGIYFYQLRSNSRVITRKMILVN